MQNYNKNFEKLMQINSYNYKIISYEKLFNKIFSELYVHHIKKSKIYKDILTRKKFSKKDQPFLPARIFKELDIISIDKKKIFKILNSSGTSGKQSKIFLDKDNAILQTKVLSKVYQDFFKIKKRSPMIIFDRSDIIKDRKLFSARGAGILGFSIFGKDHFYAFDEKNKLRQKEILKYLNKHKNEKVLIFGLTNIIWENLLNLRQPNAIKKYLRKSTLIHGGGWKKLIAQKITNQKFKSKLRNKLGIKNVFNYYGMVEQTGSIFFECEKGYFHTSIFSDIKIRDKYFSEQNYRKKGIVQLISLLPTSYPGHNLLTEDEGIIYGKHSCDCKRKGKFFKIIGRLKKSENRGCSDNYDL